MDRQVPKNVAELARLHIEQLCYPRRAGSKGERLAADYIEHHMRQLGLLIRREAFPVYGSSREWLHRLLFAGCAALVAVGGLAFPVFPVVSVLAWASVALLVNLPWQLVDKPRRSNMPPNTWTENIIGFTRPRSGASVRVIYMAHYDTKSQVLPTGVRVALVTTVWCCAWVLVTVAALRFVDFWPSGWTANPWFFSVIMIVCLAGLAANFTGDYSPGALDNASGVGALLALAQFWQDSARAANSPLRAVEAIWVATSAEETDLEGAGHFLAQCCAWWDEMPTLLINLESVGAGRRLYLAGEWQTLGWAEKEARQLGLKPLRLRVLGAGMDHQPFASRGLASVSILGDVVGCSFYLHSVRDDLRLIEVEALERSIRLALHLGISWANRHAELPVPALPWHKEAAAPTVVLRQA